MLEMDQFHGPMLLGAQELDCTIRIDEGAQRVPARFAHENMLGFMLLQDVEDDFGTPRELANASTLAQHVSVDHQSSLRRVSKVVTEHLTLAQGCGQCGVEAYRIQQDRNLVFGEVLRRRDRQNETVIVRSGYGVA